MLAAIVAEPASRADRHPHGDDIALDDAEPRAIVLDRSSKRRRISS